jgi:hypothetical protein
MYFGVFGSVFLLAQFLQTAQGYSPRGTGQASGAANAIREFGGILGVAILASVFSAHGSYATPSSFAAGLTAALPVGAAFLAAGAVIALLVPRPSREHP